MRHASTALDSAWVLLRAGFTGTREHRQDVRRVRGGLPCSVSGFMTEQEPPNIARTALRLLPLQAVLRAGEALLPIALAAWFGRGAATDLYYLLAAYYIFAAALLTGAFQDSGAVAVLIDVGAHKPSELAKVGRRSPRAHVGHQPWLESAGCSAVWSSV